MNKIILISSIITFLFAATSCEDKEWPQPDIELTSIYLVSDIQWTDSNPYGIDLSGTNPYAYEVYQDKPLLIAFRSELMNNASAYEISDFIDNSTEALFDISFTAHFEETLGEADNERDTLYTKKFVIEGDVITKECTVSITEQNSTAVSDTSVFIYSASISEDEVYN